jgi:hypothetical protein
MLEVYRVKEPGIQSFSAWIPKQPGISEISRMKDDDGSFVFLLQNKSPEPIDLDLIPGYGITIRKLNQGIPNYEFGDMKQLLKILRGKSKMVLGIDYVSEAIERSVHNARPVTVKLTKTDDFYVIVDKNGDLVPIPI